MPPARRGQSRARSAEPPGEHLERYRERRDFDRTPEPPAAAEDRDPRSPLTFVVQKHRARRLHYDLRLEVDGVMKSWPVPRGPSTDTSERRLAVMTEDHPLDYAVFEGVIPQGEYGGGEVIVWDRGTCSPDEDGLIFEDRAEASRRMREGIEAGKLSFTLRGHRMKGSWTLVKTGQAEDSWLLIKHRDAAATGVDLAEAHNDSVLTGITTEALREGASVPEVNPPLLLAHEIRGARRGQMPSSLEPMQPRQTRDPFSHPDWLFEPKLDGIRAIAFIEDGAVRLVTRRGNDVTARYPAIARALAAQPVERAVFDGEIVAPDERGVPSFERLQQRMNLENALEIDQAEQRYPVVYYAFDLLYVDGVDLRRAALEDRRPLLERTLLPSTAVRLVEPLDLDGIEAYEAVTSLGLEGLVAKRRDSTYTSGTRSPRWLKVKQRTSDDFVVVGYTPGQNARASTFGSLALAAREADGALRYVGRAGSGFDDATLRSLLARLDEIAVAKPPLSLTAETRRELRGSTWVRPELVAEIEYSQITADGHLRAPVFLRLREDKPPEAVEPDEPVPPPGKTAPRRGARPAEQRGSREVRETDVEPAAAAVLEQLDSLKQQGTIEVEGHRVRVTSLDKVMWPAHGDLPPVTKRDLIAYYARMARWLLPQVRDRPLTMTRYPDGIEGNFFYQKHIDDPPPFTETVEAFTESGGGDQHYLLVNNVATLVWLAQMADLALHTSLARVDPEPDGHRWSREFTGSTEQVERSLLNAPDFILFDLDPYIYRGDEQRGGEPELNRRAFEATCEVAVWLKELLDSASLRAYVKTSGATGLHVFVPVVRQYDYATVRDIAQTVGGLLVRAHPREVTTEWATERRRGKVFFDANQNARNKNLACAYSPRTKPGAPVSMPLGWNELGSVYPTDFTIWNAEERLARAGDLWADILEAKQDLEQLLA